MKVELPFFQPPQDDPKAEELPPARLTFEMVQLFGATWTIKVIDPAGGEQEWEAGHDDIKAFAAAILAAANTHKPLQLTNPLGFGIGVT